MKKSTFERRHYVAIAEMIALIRDEDERHAIAEHFSAQFEARNSRFKPSLFMKACGVSE